MGVIFGMGVGLCYLPHLLVAGEYFNEQRNNAFAIISSGIFPIKLKTYESQTVHFHLDP